jgi:hypothetical protein
MGAIDQRIDLSNGSVDGFITEYDPKSFSELSIRPRFATRILGFAVALVVGLDLFRILLRYTAGINRPMAFINVTWEQNLPTWFSTLLMAFAAVLMAVNAVIAFRRGDRFRWQWLILTAGFAGMSLDEATSLHERLNGMLARFHLLEGQLNYPWVIAALPFVVVVGLMFLKFVIHLPPASRRGFVLAGLIYVGGAVIVETIWSAAVLYVDRGSPASQLLRSLEESMEMGGAALFIIAILGHIARELPGTAIRIADQ